MTKDKIRPDLKVGALARLAFSTYFQSPDRDPAEIARLQDGEYCARTFSIKSTMPVLVPVDVIASAPAGGGVGQSGFYSAHWYATVFDIDGVKYRVVNDWHEPPNPLDNRTPLEDWIRRMGLTL